MTISIKNFAPKKILWKNDCWHVDYFHDIGIMPTQSSAPRHENYTTESPRVELSRQINKFLSLLISANHLEEDFWQENGTITAISFKKITQNAYGLTIFGKATCPDTFLTSKQITPYFNPEKVLEFGFHTSVAPLIKEIELYVMGATVATATTTTQELAKVV